jgi:hypothetical protein
MQNILLLFLSAPARAKAIKPMASEAPTTKGSATDRLHLNHRATPPQVTVFRFRLNQDLTAILPAAPRECGVNFRLKCDVWHDANLQLTS